jgi:hypothetical protein
MRKSYKTLTSTPQQIDNLGDLSVDGSQWSRSSRKGDKIQLVQDWMLSDICECRGETSGSVMADVFLVDRVTIVLSTKNAYQVIGKNCKYTAFTRTFL